MADDEFTLALCRAKTEAVEEWLKMRASDSPPLDQLIALAVARVALERAAAKVEADYAEVPFAGQSTEYHSGFFDGVEFAVRSILALIPPEKEPT